MRLIDADALADELAVLLERNTKLIDEWLANLIEDAVDDAPTVDAVPVVRCKDCKHNQLPPTRGNAMCELWYGMTDVYGYCHYGERREDE